MSTHAEAVNTARTKLLDLLEKLSKVEAPTARENVQSIVEVAHALNHIGAPPWPPLASINAAEPATETKQDTKPEPLTGSGTKAPEPDDPQCPSPLCEFRRSRGQDAGVTVQFVDIPLNAQPGEIIAAIKASLIAAAQQRPNG